jgi:hemerythrin-like domain-containing protein
LDEGEDMEQDEPDETPEEIAEDMIANAYDDHRVVRDMIAELRNSDVSSLEFRQSMIELQQTVAEHVSQEEDELFPQAQLNMDTKTLGMQMQQRKQEILSAAA